MGSSRLTDTEIAEMETANDTQQAVNLGVTLNITYLFESVRLPPRRCQGLDTVAERLSEVTGASGLEPVGCLSCKIHLFLFNVVHPQPSYLSLTKLIFESKSILQEQYPF